MRTIILIFGIFWVALPSGACTDESNGPSVYLQYLPYDVYLDGKPTGEWARITLSMWEHCNYLNPRFDVTLFRSVHKEKVTTFEHNFGHERLFTSDEKISRRSFEMKVPSPSKREGEYLQVKGKRPIFGGDWKVTIRGKVSVDRTFEKGQKGGKETKEMHDLEFRSRKDPIVLIYPSIGGPVENFLFR